MNKPLLKLIGQKPEREFYRGLSACLAASCLLCSCSSEPQEENPFPREAPEITVDATVRHDSDSGSAFFVQGDEIGLTVVKWKDGQPQPLSGPRQEDNVRFTYGNSGFTSSAAAYFPDKTTPCVFYAYYPYSYKGFEPGTSLLNVKVSADQSGSGYHASDYLTAVNTEVAPGAAPAPLAFDHLLSNVVIVLEPGTDCGPEQVKSAGIELVSMLTSARYDMDGKTFETLPGRSGIIPNGRPEEASDGSFRGVKAIVVPQVKRAGESVFYLRIDGRTLAYKPSSQFVFEPGSEHVLNVTLNLAGEAPSIEVSSQIQDSTDGGTVSGNAGEPAGDTDKVTDREGNVYSTVEIGALRWMAENLRSTVLDDGTPILKLDGTGTGWKAASEPAYCSLDGDDENLALYGPLYNYPTVQSGKICPAGWRLPTQEEFDDLTGGYMNRGPNLMATEGWRQNGNNSTGFTALPGGTLRGSFTNQDAGFWSSEKDGTWILYFYVSYASTYTDWKNNDGSYGMSIRCVKKIN